MKGAVGSKLSSLALAGLVVAGGAGFAAPAGGPQAPPPRKPARAFTDDDLARYREERIRNEAPAAEPTPPPSPGPPSATGAVPRLPANPAGPSVHLLDLNRTLPAEARAAAEAAGRRFVTFFGLSLTSPLVIPLRYFPDEASFRDHMDRNVDPEMRWVGYYDPTKREIVVGSSPEYFAILKHEINHFVFDTAYEEAPVWLREGLAEYFETASSTARGLAIADQPRHRLELGEWLKGDRQPDLRDLLALNRSMWRDHEVAASRRIRALSWSVVAFLMSSPGGQAILQDFLAALKDQSGLYSLQAFHRTFPGGAAAFERQWLDHVQQQAQAAAATLRPSGSWPNGRALD